MREQTLAEVGALSLRAPASKKEGNKAGWAVWILEFRSAAPSAKGCKHFGGASGSLSPTSLIVTGQVAGTTHAAELVRRAMLVN